MIPAGRIRQRKLPAAGDSLPPTLHPVSRRVLRARGVADEDALSRRLGRMHPIDELGGARSASVLLADAVMQDRSVLVVGDFDADGATGTALAILALQAMGGRRVGFRVPNRFEFGYGLTVPLVETLAADPPELLVTVDSGIACNRGVARARELGCGVIVTDHHLPGEELPAAHAIVNPNAPGDAFPSKALAGVGVMFYLLGAVRAELRERGWFGAARPEPRLADWLDLVALGTVADLVPLDHNNRILIWNGLQRIRRGLARPGIMALLRLGKRDYRHTSAADLGFAVGPRLNAAGRLEDMAAGIRCLLTDDTGEAARLAGQLDELNRQRRTMQQQMQQEAMDQTRELLDGLREQDLPPALCLHDEAWHQGVVGLVASRVKDALHRPVIAFAPEAPGASLLKGSARSVRGLHIRDVLALVDARRPGLMQAFGGHAMAAGLTLPRERLPEFRELLDRVVTSALDGATLEREVLTDGELAAHEIGQELALELEGLGPWGQRFSEPVFEGCFEIVEQRVVGGSHLKLRLRPPGGEAVDAIAFNCLPEDLPGGGSLRCLYRLSVNRWRERSTCQLVVEEIVAQ